MPKHESRHPRLRPPRAAGPRVVVAGGGMAGLIAAASALEAGADVIVLEKGDRLGGSMRLSRGYVMTYGELDALRADVPGGDARLQSLLVSCFDDGSRWLAEQGVELDPQPSGGGFVGFRFGPAQLIDALRARIDALGGSIELRAQLTGLRATPEGRLAGVSATVAGEPRELDADAVVLATGGFQGSAELMQRHCGVAPDQYRVRANPWSTGDGLRAALAIGARSGPGLEHFYGHGLAAPPASFDERSFAEMTQYQGHDGVALDARGRRFADESDGPGEEILNQSLARLPGGLGWYVGDEEVAELPSVADAHLTVHDVLARSLDAGAVVCRGETLDALCRRLAEHGVDGAHALATLTAVRAGERVVDGVPRSAPRGLGRPPYWAIKVHASVTFTTGGLAVDETMAVLRDVRADAAAAVSGATIAGLFAAGSDVGGFSHREYAGGLASALVGGRRAGRSAAALVS